MHIGSIAEKFRISGTVIDSTPWGNGHIHETYLVICQNTRYILQRINPFVFPDPSLVMKNICLVLAHIEKKNTNSRKKRRTLTIIPTHDGQSYYRDSRKNCWRLYAFVEGGHSCDYVNAPSQARQIASAFGSFQAMLVDFSDRLCETIPDFHNSEKRFLTLQESITKDICNRATKAKKEIEFSLRHCDLCCVLANLQRQGKVSPRITHNDAKANNAILDNYSGKWLCVIDLDTVMPGLALYDFGDMVRSIASATDEDERNLSRVKIELPLFQALVEGYLQTADFLNEVEIQHLVVAGKVITFETGIRFLSDYLSGDVYFKTHGSEHNLDRCRNQFRLLEEIFKAENKMNRIVKKESSKHPTED